MYNTTAFLYDATSAFEELEKTRDLMHGTFLEYGLSPPAMLGDLGSGTGVMSILLAARGWHVYGIELSRAMLDMAEEKTSRLPEANQARLSWTQGDITNFELPDHLRLDGAVCLCNTINHLTEWHQVEGFMRCAFRALKPGGILILDSDTLGTFLGFFNHEPTVVWDDGMHRMTRACTFNAETGQAHHVATLERYHAEGLQPVSEEAMQLQYHPERELMNAFSAAGFEVRSTEPFNPNPKLYAGDIIPKILWVAQKPDAI